MDFPQWEQDFREAVKGLDYDPNFYSMGVSQRILEAVRQPLATLHIQGTEQERIQDFGFARYTSRPDGVGVRYDGRRVTVDLKYTEARWRSLKEPWPVRPLKPYDDQLLGQAILSKADIFSRLTIRRHPKTGTLADPVYEECLVDAALREEWLVETRETMRDIEDRLASGDVWEKNEDACFAYGQACPHIKNCIGGLKGVK